MCGANNLELLGNNAKSSSPPESEDVVNLRLERFRLQFEARKLLLNEGSKLVASGDLAFKQNIHRTAKCLFTRHSQHVDIKKSVEHNKAFYAGLVVCGSVWSCPVCAAKVQERRRIEVAQAFDWAYSTSEEKPAYKVIMVTFTFPHNAWQKLSDLLAMQSDAYRRLRSGKAWQSLKSRVGYEGMIRSLELTIGDNGWHPHTHEAWIVDPDCDVEVLRDQITDRWMMACDSAGISINKPDAFRRRAVDIVDNARSSDYLAKQDSSKNWGADRELVKGSAKVGKHPFSLLTKSFDGDNSASCKFLEYTFAMKGKAQLFWSRGLKDRVGINDISDEEIATRQEDIATDIANFDAADWAVVMKSGRDARSNLLDLAENGGTTSVMDYLQTLKKRPAVIVNRESGHPVRSESSSYKELINDLVVKLSIKSEIAVDDFIRQKIIR
jgi:hypothetical protein